MYKQYINYLRMKSSCKIKGFSIKNAAAQSVKFVINYKDNGECVKQSGAKNRHKLGNLASRLVEISIDGLYLVSDIAFSQ